MNNNFGEQMHLMGQIEALLRLEVELMQQRSELELKLEKLKEKANSNKESK